MLLLVRLGLVELPEPRLEHFDPLRLLDLVQVLPLGRAGSGRSTAVGATRGVFGLATGVGGADELVEGEEGALIELVNIELNLLVDVL